MDAAMKVAIIPCSGIGKTYGSVSREAAYVVAEELRPEATTLIALSRLVMGDPEARGVLSASPAVTIDGCKLACASKMVQENGGQVFQAFQVLDVYRRYRHLKPQGIAELNEQGRKLAQVLGAEVAQAVDAAHGGDADA